MATFLADLEPTPVWRHFDTILTIPRASGNEERIRRLVIDRADACGLEHDVDVVGNLVVRKPGTPGHEATPATILQAHLDMVNEKNADHAHDFATDPIVPRRSDGYLTASGTTLGSDNGIGVATMLAVMEASDLTHGPLELLFTVDEESGLTGAAGLDPSLLTGRRLINLDSEEDGVLYVGCAGGGDSQLVFPLVLAPVDATDVALDLALTGLRGGHSGCDIHRQRGNAVKLLTRALWAGYQTAPFRLRQLEGGSAHNAIPREAFASVLTAPGRADAVIGAVRREVEAIAREHRLADPDLGFEVRDAAGGPGDRGRDAWSRETGVTVLRLLDALPHGVEAMSPDIPGLVETSSNVATLTREGTRLRIGVSTRSSSDAALEALRRRIRAIGQLAGAEVVEDAAYPGWTPDLDSPLLATVRATYERVFGQAPGVAAIHAGLECGIIGKKAPGMDMVSFGPQIEHPHSPDERVEIASVGRFYTLLTATLEALATGS